MRAQHATNIVAETQQLLTKEPQRGTLHVYYTYTGSRHAEEADNYRGE
jgi:hypothetical protein